MPTAASISLWAVAHGTGTRRFQDSCDDNYCNLSEHLRYSHLRSKRKEALHDHPLARH